MLSVDLPLRGLQSVRRINRLPIHLDAVVPGFALNSLPARRDDPLHDVILRGSSQPNIRRTSTQHLAEAAALIQCALTEFPFVPGLGASKHDDVARLGGTEIVGKLIDENAVVIAARAPIERRLHGFRGNNVDTPNKDLEQNSHEERAEDNDRDFDIPGAFLLHRGRSGG